MNFTKREIELAKQLKESGIEWKPEAGDWFILEHVAHPLLVTRPPDSKDGACIIKAQDYTIYKSHIGVTYTWLPLWHQARGLLSEFTPFIFNGKPPMLTIQTWQFTGDTDLEVMYRAMLELEKEGAICLK